MSTTPSSSPFAHGHDVGDIISDARLGGLVEVAPDGTLIPWTPIPDPDYAPGLAEELAALSAGAAAEAAEADRRMAAARLAFESRPTEPPGELHTDAAGNTWETPREPLDIWDPDPDATEAAIVAKIAALRALPDPLASDDASPDGSVPVLDYAMPARVHNARHDGWTRERQEAFLQHLAGTASVTEAARHVEMSRQSARQLYNRDPDFRRGWVAALRRAKMVLLDSLFDRAVRGTQVPVWKRDGTLLGYRERHHDRLAIALIRLCGGAQFGLVGPDDDEDDDPLLGGMTGSAKRLSLLPDGADRAADDSAPLVWPLPTMEGSQR